MTQPTNQPSRHDSAALLGSSTASEQMKQLVDELTQQNKDLQIVLATTAEHGDMIESLLCETNIKLKAEIAERQRAQNKLQTLLDLITRQKDDLEIIMSTILEHGDVVDAQWREKLGLTTEMANIDPLTQCYNRRRFDDYLVEQWRLHSKEEIPLSMILCDIDHFKLYNDFYGHLSGDDCLRRVAQALSATLRNPGDVFCRYGGEEFVAILPSTDREGAKISAERMRGSLANLQIPHHPSPISDYVTISGGIGIAFPSQEDADPKSLISRADSCLFKAKREGRDRIASHGCDLA
jgi:diguanylate cyclase (GGDEF)-like protein